MFAFFQLALFVTDTVQPVITGFILRTSVSAVFPEEGVLDHLGRPQPNQQSSLVEGNILVTDALSREQLRIWTFQIRGTTWAGAFTPATFLGVEQGVQGPTVWVQLKIKLEIPSQMEVAPQCTQKL